MRKKKTEIIISLILVSIFLVLTCEACTHFKRESKVKIRRNGYTDIVIGIEDSVDEDPMLIERIKESFIEASELLFNITK